SAQALSLLRRFAANDDVVAVLGPTGTPDLLAILPVAQGLGVLVLRVGSQKTMAKEAFPDDVFRVGLIGKPEVIAYFLERVSRTHPVTRIGLFIDRANDSSQAESAALRDALKSISNIAIAEEATYVS